MFILLVFGMNYVIFELTFHLEMQTDGMALALGISLSV